MKNKKISKIIYFDKETICNILQEYDRGSYTKTLDVSSTLQSEGAVETGAKIKLDVPFWDRIGFLFSGRIAASFIVKRDSMTTISSTEISEFEKLKPLLIEKKDIQIKDIKNSSTTFRVAGGYLRIMQGGVDGVDTKQFNSVMEGYDGYDTYRIGESEYIRFNNTAFVSNYKRNELLKTKMTIYCICVGEFDRKSFDFFDEIRKMEQLFSVVEKNRTLADVFPSCEKETSPTPSVQTSTTQDTGGKIQLYDAVYASIEPIGGAKN